PPPLPHPLPYTTLFRSHSGVTLATAKVQADIGLGHSADFPSAIEMFEALPSESGFSLIAENQISLGERGVSAEVPGLADTPLSRSEEHTSELQSRFDLV